MGTSAPDTHGADTDHDAGKWSDAELSELEDLLMYEISIQEIARLPRQDHNDVQDKIVDTDQGCR